jgi:nucleoside-diphosphate-sugar epimerase
MKKRVLILGGSYFIGRVFSIMAERTGDFELWVINRGRFPLKKPEIHEYVFNRHDRILGKILEKEEPFDAFIDFCAYEPGDCSEIICLLKEKIKHYIEISSCSVFAPTEEIRHENSLFVSQQPKNPVEEYAYKKMMLEKEVQNTCGVCGIPYTILRPCFVYGPFNYAPRESWYFDLILKTKKIPVPVDVQTEFSFVYVKDIARAIMGCINNDAAYNKSYNLSAPENINYSKLTEVLICLMPGITTVEIPLKEIYAQNIPVPFPLEQNELFNGEKAQADLAFRYTMFAEGMKEAFETYKASHS